MSDSTSSLAAPAASAASAAAPQTVALFDARPFFEKALAYGLQHGLINAPKLDAIATEAPKGMVQIARYFGSEFLRPELERARERIVNLVSLNLEHASGGDLHRAAEALRDHSLLSRSKGASDMLKALIAMPQSSHFGMNEMAAFATTIFRSWPSGRCAAWPTTRPNWPSAARWRRSLTPPCGWPTRWA